jgi:hypothetical protein
MVENVLNDCGRWVCYIVVEMVDDVETDLNTLGKPH